MSYDHDKIYIDGAWVPSQGTSTIDVFDSTNGEVIGHIPDGNAADVDAAVKAAAAAFPGWAAKTSAEERAKYCTPHRRGPRRPHGRDRHRRHPRGGHAEVAEPHDPGRPADQLVQHRGPDRGELRVRDHRSATAWSCASRRRRRLPSRRGTTRCTRSPPRSPTRWPPAAPWCSSRARSPRSTPSSSPRSSTTSACRPACSTSSPAPGPRSARPSSSHPQVDMVSFTGSTRAGKAVSAAAVGQPQARGPRARRQVRQHPPRRPRRRRLRERPCATASASRT